MAATDNKSDSKLIIKAYSDNKFSTEKGEFTTEMNPSSIKISSNLSYSIANSLGSPSNNIKYNTSLPRILEFSITFDGTGIYNGKKESVSTQVDKLKSLVYDFQDTVKSTYYIRVIWGLLDFKGRLVSMDVSYVMFEANGVPLRAEVDISIIESTEIKSSPKEAATKKAAPEKEPIQGKAKPTEPAKPEEHPLKGKDEVDSLRPGPLPKVPVPSALALFIAKVKAKAGQAGNYIKSKALWVKQKVTK